MRVKTFKYTIEQLQCNDQVTIVWMRMPRERMSFFDRASNKNRIALCAIGAITISFVPTTSLNPFRGYYTIHFDQVTQALGDPIHNAMAIHMLKLFPDVPAQFESLQGAQYFIVYLVQLVYGLALEEMHTKERRKYSKFHQVLNMDKD